MPTISVIVPVYKVEPYLHRCVDSILAQTYTDFELILVDDGSPDNCGKICDEYKEKDDRVVVIHKENGGLSSARNAGLDIAKGEWVTFIDSDDWVYREYLERLYNACIDNNVDISVCGYFNTDGEECEISKSAFDVKLYKPEDLWCENQVNSTVAWGKLYRLSLWNEIRYPIGKIHEDEYTTYKLLFKCEKLAFTEADMYFYYKNPNGIMQSEWNPKRLHAIQAFKNQAEFFKANNYNSAYELSENKYEKVLDYCYRQTESKYPAEHKKLKFQMRIMYIKNKQKFKQLEGWDYLYSEFFPLEIKVRSYYIEAIKRLKRIIGR